MSTVKNLATPTGNAFIHDKSVNKPYEPEQDQLFFELQDQQGHVFQIGLMTLLQCLAFAEEQEELPVIGYPWWNGVLDHYHLKREDLFCSSEDV